MPVAQVRCKLQEFHAFVVASEGAGPVLRRLLPSVIGFSALSPNVVGLRLSFCLLLLRCYRSPVRAGCSRESKKVVPSRW